MGVADDVLTATAYKLKGRDAEDAFFAAADELGRGIAIGIPGLGAAGQARLLVAIEIGKRMTEHRVRRNSRPKRHSRAPNGQDTPGICEHEILAKINPTLRSSATEWIGFVPVYQSGRIGAFHLVESGTRSHVNVSTRELFSRILSTRADAVCLFHNHPSGNLQPSAADRRLTDVVDGICTALSIPLLGHWVVCGRSCARML